MRGKNLERRLEILGLDGLDANLRCIADTGRLAETAQRRLLKSLLRRRDGGARRPAIEGKLLCNLGQPEQACLALERSLGLDKDQPQARSWLAGACLLAGRYEDSLRHAASSAAQPWSPFYSAAALCVLGRRGQARRALKPLLQESPEAEPALAARVLTALMDAGEGRLPEALKRMDEVVAARPREAWPYALRSRLHGGSDKAASLRDLAAALKRNPPVWVYLERSRLYEELGDLPRALRDVEAALAEGGASAELFLRRAHIQVCRRHYHLAVPAYTQAIALRPKDPQAYLGRAMVHCTRNHLEEAVRDALRAEKVSGDPAVALERIRMQIYAGEAARVEADLDGLSRKFPGFAGPIHFLKGCHKLKQRFFGEAALCFGQAQSLGGENGIDLKAGFYRAAALSLAAAEAQPRLSRPQLVICGLGIKPPYTATAEVLRAIVDSDFIFNNLSEPEVAALLRLLSSDGRPTMFDIRGADERWTRTIFKEVRPGRTVAFVTRGHPVVCGGLAGSLIEESRRQGVGYRLFGAVSSMNTLAIAALPQRQDGFWGQQVLDYSSVFCAGFSIDTRIPAVIYFNATIQEMPRRTYLRFCSLLEQSYSLEHRCYFYGRNFAAAPDLIPLRELRGYHGRFDPSYTLLIPPK